MAEHKIVFFGSGEFAVPVLKALAEAEKYRVAGVVTQPDSPKGRHLRLAACPVKKYATEIGLKVLTPNRVNSEDFLAVLRGLAPDMAVLAAYGQIISRQLLVTPRFGFVNAHASLLPKYRGAAPIQWAIANGETVTGVTIIRMNERMDAGDIIVQCSEQILAEDTAASLQERLAQRGAALLLEAMEAIFHGAAEYTPQDETQASYAPKLTKACGRIDWTQPASSLHNRIRAFYPWPGCFFYLPEAPAMPIKILKARPEGEGAAGIPPGTVLETEAAEGPLIQTGAGALRLLRVQPSGRREMSGAAFACGRHLRSGEILM